MKPNKLQKDHYFANTAMDICKDIDKLDQGLADDWNKNEFGKGFFANIIYYNYLSSLDYLLGQLKTHLYYCRKLRIPKDNFAVQHAEFYIKWHKDLFFSNFIHALRIKIHMFGYSEKAKEEMRIRTNKIAKEIIDELIDEEKQSK